MSSPPIYLPTITSSAVSTSSSSECQHMSNPGKLYTKHNVLFCPKSPLYLLQYFVKITLSFGLKMPSFPLFNSFTHFFYWSHFFYYFKGFGEWGKINAHAPLAFLNCYFSKGRRDARINTTDKTSKLKVITACKKHCLIFRVSDLSIFH